MAVKKVRGLGRGLDALLDDNVASAGEGELRQVELQRLKPGKYQPRTRMDQESLQTLADSIRSQGLMQPIIVRDIGESQMEIIAGERRWRAAEMAGLTQVTVVVREIPDEAALAMALIENIQREDLNPLEEAAGIQRLIDEFGMTHQSAADAVGRSRSAVTNLLRLLNLPQTVQDMMMDASIDMGHGRALLALPEDMQVMAANHVADHNLTVRETEKWIARLMTAPVAKTREPDHDVLALTEQLSDKLGMKVGIQSKRNGSGKLVIEYTDLTELDRLINRL